MLRLFIGLPIPDEIAKILIPLQNGIEGARFSPRENLHITLRFIGDLSIIDAEDLDIALSEIRQKQFDLALKRVGHFGSDKPHSIHANVILNDALLSLHEKCNSVCGSLGIIADRKKYIPHVTLAYMSANANLGEVISFNTRNSLFASPQWRADCFHLYSSKIGNGPSKYRIEASYPLL